MPYYDDLYITGDIQGSTNCGNPLIDNIIRSHFGPYNTSDLIQHFSDPSHNRVPDEVGQNTATFDHLKGMDLWFSKEDSTLAAIRFRTVGGVESDVYGNLSAGNIDESSANYWKMENDMEESNFILGGWDISTGDMKDEGGNTLISVIMALSIAVMDPDKGQFSLSLSFFWFCALNKPPRWFWCLPVAPEVLLLLCNVGKAPKGEHFPLALLNKTTPRVLFCFTPDKKRAIWKFLCISIRNVLCRDLVDYTFIYQFLLVKSETRSRTP